jgi:hypothetical protein
MNYSEELKLIAFYEAVLQNDGMEVQRLLRADSLLEETLTTKILTGILVITVEKGLKESSQAIVEYNATSKEKIPDEQIDIITKYSLKNNLTPLTKACYN